MQSASIPCTSVDDNQSSMLARFRSDYSKMVHSSISKQTKEIVEKGLVEATFTCDIPINIYSKCELSLVYCIDTKKDNVSITYCVKNGEYAYEEVSTTTDQEEIMDAFEVFGRLIAYISFLAEMDEEITFDVVSSLFNQ